MRITIFGAGSIGCYLGGRLLHGGADVVLIGRQRMRDVFAQHGLTVTDLNGFRATVPPGQVLLETDPACLGKSSVILLTVKSKDTASAADEIRAHAADDAVIVSLQNGIRNATILQERLPGHQVLAGMVPFNVVNQGDGHFHCGTVGELAIEASNGCEWFFKALTEAGLEAARHQNMPGVLWAKLLLNLNNPIVALSGLPLVQELRNATYRRVLAMSIAEALAVLRRAKIRPASVGKVRPVMLPFLLKLPTFLFVVLARSMLRMDPAARSSMWEDLQRGRRTEVDYLNGEIVELATTHHVEVPVNRGILELIRQAEQAGKGSPGISADELLAAVRKR